MKFRSLALVALLVPVALWAQDTTDWLPQSAAPDAVNQALTERVSQFLNYHIGTANFRAMDLVAEESKETYFGAGKTVIKSFKVTNIEYASSDFNRAAVTTEVTRDMHLEGQTFEGTSALVSNWKIEDGKWVWFLDRTNSMVTPMGVSDFSNPVDMLNTFTKDGKLPEGFNTEAAMASQMSAILGQAGLDKNQVRFSWNRPGQDTITLKNAFPGEVSLSLLDQPTFPGLKIALEKAVLKPGENGVVNIEFTPQPGEPKAARHFEMRLVLSPFNRHYRIILDIDPSLK